MSLVLEIEYLSGVSFAAIGPDTDAPDWPPQPDRIFSALVATWAARGEDGHEAAALEWLENLPAPRMLASDAHPRTAPIVFVPPNDPRSDKQKNAKGVLPAWRSRQARRFPAARPSDPVVRLFWIGVEPAEETLATLTRLAHDTAYIGHSTSLTRCRFQLDYTPRAMEAKLAERTVYAGRFAELRRAFDAGRRPLPGARVKPVSEVRQQRANAFDERWLILEHIGGDMPDLRACVLVSKTIRDALFSGYQRIGLGTKIPEVISGHGPDGGPARASHLAILPLPFTGFPYADGHVMGFALVPPHDSAVFDDENFRKSLRTVAPLDERWGRRVLTLKTKQATASNDAHSITVSPTYEPPGRSLDPALYTRSSTIFATVTPIALDRHLKEQGDARQAEIAAQIAGACRNIGLPEPKEIVADKHSAVEGAPSAYPSSRSPDWMRWRLPSSLASRHLTHAVIRFASAVDGPVILGAGRFIGLGLCRPLDRAER
jgi:CRISPR-associated protein Csb2